MLNRIEIGEIGWPLENFYIVSPKIASCERGRVLRVVVVHENPVAGQFKLALRPGQVSLENTNVNLFGHGCLNMMESANSGRRARAPNHQRLRRPFECAINVARGQSGVGSAPDSRPLLIPTANL